MDRYFARLKYRGTRYAGWQSQPNANTVQDEIESKLSILLRKHTKIMGCGRTDAGVHASDFVMHFDARGQLDENLIFKLNMMLPDDIVITKIDKVNDAAHSRFDAISRSYEYHIHRRKDPFNQGHSYYYPHLFTHDLQMLNECSNLLINYADFYTFCKTNTDVKTTLCTLTKSEWVVSESDLTFHITANRFLRGMVRLIVGCCLNVTTGKLSIDDVIAALSKTERLKRDLSVPAEGLFLTDISYPESIYIKESPPYVY